MTFEKILEDLIFNNITLKEANALLMEKEKMKTIHYFINRGSFSNDPLKDGELNQLNAIVGILQILYTSDIGSPISDENYDTLQEMLVNMGIPRLTGSVEINSMNKMNHQYTNLRGTLSKIYYLSLEDRRVNKSRRYLDEWIKSCELKYEKKTGDKISLGDTEVILTPKFDGVSAVAEVDSNGKIKWLTRGDTNANQASDVSHIMNIFNDLYSEHTNSGIKFEVMMTEENKDRINELYQIKNYKNSRQIVTATLNSKEADYKAEYLYPVPLRIIKEGDTIEQVHPDLISKFPSHICKLSDRLQIQNFASDNRWVNINGMRFRTDGIVITILNPFIQSILGRENNINNFEVAYKFTSESAYTNVVNCEFYVSEFGYITPVIVTKDVLLKGNTINHISISNKERFDELDLCYGDLVKIEYDIIPYLTIDEYCHKINAH